MAAPALIAGKSKHSLKLSAARMEISRKAPYWMLAVRSLAPVEMEGLGTMGVNERGVMFYDPEFVQTQTVKHLATVLVHEALHLVFRHPRRAKAYGPSLNHALWNMATDMEINDGLAAGGWDMGDGILPKSFGLPDGLMAEEYYRRLREMGAQPPAQPRPMNGWDGSGGGHALPGEPPPEAPKSEKEASRDGQGGQGAPPPTGSPQATPAQTQELGQSDEALEALATETAQAMKRAGQLPGRFQRWADERTAPPKERWQDRLAKVCRLAAARTRGYGRVSYSRSDRKQAGIGYGPGKPIIPGQYKPTPRVAVAIDTSGSMTNDVLGSALAEVRSIFTAAGAPVDFLACDAEVHVHERLRDYRQVKSKLVGGGGTDFRPVFKALAGAQGADRPEALIFVTDGYGTAPSAPPPDMQVIWLLVEGGVAPAPWGEVVKLGVDQ